MDTCLWNFAIPRVDGGRGLECCLATTVRRLQRKSYQDWITRTPVRLGGMGFRSVEETSLLAYIGGVEQALSNFIGEGGVCQQLLSTGNRTGEELAWAWDTLRQEAVESYRFLGKEVDGLLEREVQGAGDGQSDGSTRRALTKWVEDTRNSLLVKALELLPDQTSRPAWVHPQHDKLSQGWILSLPGHRGFTQAEFSETVARLLCLPSPCCQPKVGTPLHQHGLHIDMFGDNIMSQ